MFFTNSYQRSFAAIFQIIQRKCEDIFLKPTPPFIFLFLFFTNLLLALKSLNNFWLWDDLHLIRVFTLEEMSSTWSGRFDPDNIETVGFRPLTVLFNHFRALLFGENVVGQHLLLVLLFPLFLTLMVEVFYRLGLPRQLLLVAGIITLCAKNSAYHFGWLSDGIHIFQGLIFSLAILASLRFLSTSKWSIGFFSLSLLFYLMLILIREDGLAMAPVIIGLAVYLLFWFSPYPARVKIKLLKLSALVFGITMVTGCFWFWRGRALAGASDLKLSDITRWPGLVVDQFVFTMQLSGRRDLPEFFEVLFKLALYFMALFPFFLLTGQTKKDNVLKLFVTAFLPQKSGKDCFAIKLWQFSLIFLVFSFCACLNSLVLQRSNLTFFSTFFYACALSTLALAYLMLIKDRARSLFNVSVLLTGLVFALAIILSVRSNLLLQESMSFYSTQSIYWNSEMMFNPDWKVTMPDERREKMLTALAALGIDQSSYKISSQSSGNPFNKLYCAAQEAGRQHPNNLDAPFIPLQPLFYDDGWKYAAPPCYSLK